MSEVNDYLSKYDKDLAKSIAYRIYGMPGPIFSNVAGEGGDTPGPGPLPTEIPFYVENITEETETAKIMNKSGVNTGEIIVQTSSDMTEWTTIGTIASEIPQGVTLEITLEPGERVYVRGISANKEQIPHAIWGGENSGHKITGSSKIGGNILSLVYGDEFNGQTDYPEEFVPESYYHTYTFAYLFRDWDEETETSLIDASELILPDTLLPYCYYSMFHSRSSLVKGPVLRATTVAEGCYASMFESCSSLNEITTYANDATQYECDNWLSNVSWTGTLHNLGTSTYLVDNASGIPEGWTEVHE